MTSNADLIHTHTHKIKWRQTDKIQVKYFLTYAMRMIYYSNVIISITTVCYPLCTKRFVFPQQFVHCLDNKRKQKHKERD